MNKIILVLNIMIISFCSFAQQKPKVEKIFTESLMQSNCTFVATGRNTYFILEPNFQLVLDGMDGKDSVHLIITVLNETRQIGNVETRVVEERESANGHLVEISRNYLTFCKETSSIYYFGEDVDIYRDGKVVSHESAWLAEGKNKAGVQMPGLVLLGSRFYQEIAPKVAMDRVEVLSLSETLATKAGTFKNCLKIEETTPLEPKAKDYKVYAPEIGLVQDGNLFLTKYGFIK